MIDFYKEPDSQILENVLRGENLTTTFFYKLLTEYKLLLSEEIYILTEGEKISIANQFDIILSILKDLYKENFDIKYVKENDKYKIYIVLKFDEITIENSDFQEHLIEDLFVFIPLHLNILSPIKSLCFRTPLGSRTTISCEEWHKGYQHSHLMSLPYRAKYTAFNYKNTFCIGSSTSLAEQITKSLLENYIFNPLLIEGFFYAINDFVIWESLEGVPYSYIRDLEISLEQVSENISKDFCFNFLICKDILEDIKQDNISIDVKYTLKNNFSYMYFTELGLKQLLEYLVNKEKYLNKKIFVSKTDDKNYYSIVQTRNIDIILKREEIDNHLNMSGLPFYIFFRNQKQYLNVKEYTNLIEEEIDIKTLIKSTAFIHPMLIKGLENLINTENKNNERKYQLLRAKNKYSHS